MHRHFFHRADRCADRFEEAMFAGRRHGGRGFGPFEGFMGGPGKGGHGFRFGRKLGSNDLQVVLLALLAERPSHGYELIKALDERSAGFYSPSPGMVYPALTWLEEVGYASVEVEGSRKLYTITEAGRDYLGEHREEADAVLEGLERIGRKMGRMREAFAEDEDDGAPTGARELWLARNELRRALRSKWRDASPTEARRIAEVLRRAAREILGEG